MDEVDRLHLQRCVDLASAALDAGHAPFGSILVSGEGEVLAQDHNRTGDGDPTSHPEIALVRWAISHLSPDERAAATVYTSGEHCAMCAAAHGWSGLGPIVYAASGAQLDQWCAEAGALPAPVATLPVGVVAPGVRTRGPFPDFERAMRALHLRFLGATPSGPDAA